MPQPGSRAAAAELHTAAQVEQDGADFSIGKRRPRARRRSIEVLGQLPRSLRKSASAPNSCFGQVVDVGLLGVASRGLAGGSGVALAAFGRRSGRPRPAACVRTSRASGAAARPATASRAVFIRWPRRCAAAGLDVGGSGELAPREPRKAPAHNLPGPFAEAPLTAPGARARLSLQAPHGRSSLAIAPRQPARVCRQSRASRSSLAPGAESVARPSSSKALSVRRRRDVKSRASRTSDGAQRISLRCPVHAVGAL